MSLENELQALERKFWTEGADFYRENLDEQCVVVFTEMAGVKTREEIASMIGAQPRYREVAIEPKAVHRLDRSTAIFAYQANARMADGTRYRALVSSLYVERVGGWKMAFHQQTPLPAT
jgi:hypothetical protein